MDNGMAMENEMSKIGKCAPEDCSTCGEDCGSRINLNDKVIQITTDDGDQMDCLIILKYSMGTGRYIAVMPLKDNPDADIFLFRMVDHDSQLENIEDEDEYQEAARIFGLEMEKAQEAKAKES